MKSLIIFYSIAILSVAGMGCSSNSSEPNNNTSNVHEFGDGYKLYNLIPNFLSYADKGSGLSESERISLWDSELESKYPDFFNQVIYRNLEGNERLRYKQDIINEFWNKIVPNQKAKLKDFYPNAVQKILNGRSIFVNKFSDFNPQCDYYLTIAFSFHGKAVGLNDKTILAIGLENFEPSDINLEFTIAHEQYHLHHFGKGFSASGALYRGVWAEGLATYCQMFVHPGNYSYSKMLGFPGSRIDDIVNNWASLRNNLKSNLTSSEQDIKRAYLGVEVNQLGIPPGAGYYFGLRIVLTLIDNGYTFQELTLWSADKALSEMNGILSELKAN